MLWIEQSWPKFEKLDKNIPVIVPVGSVEQHGRHLPVVVDTLQVTHIAEQAEKQLGEEALLTPTLWLGSSHHHLDFPGTISITPQLYSQVIQQIAQSIIAAGFRRIIFLNGHGGNHVPVSQALAELSCVNDQADDTHLILATWWQLAREKIKADQLGMETQQLSHACEYETSNVMHLRPDLVDLDQAQEAPLPLDDKWTDMSGSAKCVVTTFKRFHRCTPSGSMGKPTLANAEKGKRLLDAVVSVLVDYVRDVKTWPETPVIGGPNR